MPQVAIVHWQNTLRVGATKTFRQCEIRYVPKWAPDDKTPQIAGNQAHLIGLDAFDVDAPYQPPVSMWAMADKHLRVFLARQYFREKIFGDLLAFKDQYLAIGCALATGESLVTSFTLPSQETIKIVRKWGARLRVCMTVS